MAVHAWLDVGAGVAGDMLLGAALDAGVPLDQVQQLLDELVPGQVRLRTETVLRGGQRGTKVHVDVLVDDPPHRTWASIRTMLQAAAIPEQTRTWALAAFAALAAAEARVHGTSPDEVHFHEVGALDSIADVVGTCEALRLLGVGSISASPVALGEGRVRAAHGDIPVPVPAVAELVLGWQVVQTTFSGELAGHEHPHQHAHGHEHSHGHSHTHQHDTPAPVTVAGAVGELATPTGVALVRALASRCEPLPSITVTGVGVGCGGKDFADHPNIVRLLLGVPTGPAGSPAQDPDGARLEELAANVDDLDPRLWPGVLDALLAAGARDAWLVPIVMKKGRPAFTVHALATAQTAPGVGQVLLGHTSTLGYRQHSVARTMLERAWSTLDVAGQPVRVKVGHRDSRVVHAAVEFDDLAAAAAATDRSQSELAALASSAIAAAGIVPGAPWPLA